jgi:hypothetical protein
MIIEHDIVCTKCKGTGLYQGMRERDDVAIVCRICKGTGCGKLKLDVELFTQRNDIRNIRRVYRIHPRQGPEVSDTESLEDFGGMPYKEWAAGFDFPAKSEDRKHTCPCWFYQSADYKLKPDWSGCNSALGRTFSHCQHFAEKDKCWERWDKEFGGLRND